MSGAKILVIDCKIFPETDNRFIPKTAKIKIKINKMMIKSLDSSEKFIALVGATGVFTTFAFVSIYTL